MAFNLGIKALAGKAPELYMYDEIGGWGADPVTIATVRARLNEVGEAPELTVRINSLGGDVTQGMAIYSAISEFAGKKTVVVEGIAASIASVIAMSGDEVVMTAGSFLMVHNPFGFVQGESKDLRRTADLLDSMRARMLDIYQAATGLPLAELEAMVDAETYLTAEEAVAKGFADRVSDVGARMVAAAKDLKGAPEALKKAAQAASKKEPQMTEEEIAKMKADLKAAQEECASLKDKLKAFEKDPDVDGDDDSEDEPSEDAVARAQAVAAAIQVTGEQDLRKLPARILALTSTAPSGRKAVVEKAVSDGILPPGMKTWAMSTPRAALDAFIASAKPVARAQGGLPLPAVAQPPVKDVVAPKALTSLERELMAKMGRTEAQMLAARDVVVRSMSTQQAAPEAD